MRLSANKRMELISLVIAQLERDFENGETDGICALLMGSPNRDMFSFLAPADREYLGVDKSRD